MSDKPKSAGEKILEMAAGATSSPPAGDPPATTEPPKTDPAPTPPETGSGDQTETGKDQRVPLDRFQTVTTENKELREKVAQFEQEKAEREKAAMTELERAQAERDEERQKREAAEQKAVSLERGGWLRSAAATANFADPEDAIALIGLDTVEDQLAAQTAVKELAEKKPHLIATGKKGPTPIGNPLPSGGASGSSSSPGAGEDPKATVGKDLFNLLTGKK